MSTLNETRHDLSDGDVVKFSEIEGMSALNGTEHVVKTLTPYIILCFCWCFRGKKFILFLFEIDSSFQLVIRVHLMNIKHVDQRNWLKKYWYLNLILFFFFKKIKRVILFYLFIIACFNDIQIIKSKLTFNCHSFIIVIIHYLTQHIEIKQGWIENTDIRRCWRRTVLRSIAYYCGSASVVAMARGK